MKRLPLIAILSLSPFLFLSAQENFIVKGKIGHLNAPAKIFLYYWKMPGFVPTLDSAVLVDGVFAFKGSIPYPIDGALHLRRNGENFYKNGFDERCLFYLENGTVSITGDSLQTATVDGGGETRNYKELQAMTQAVRNEREQFFRDQYKLPKEQRLPQAALAEKARQFQAEERDAYARFVRAHTNSFVSLNLIRTSYGKTPPVAEVGPLYHLLSARVRASQGGKEYGNAIARWETAVPGSQAPDFTMKDTLGRAVSLHEFRGKYVLLNFWATWCGPCMEEKRDLKKTYASFKDKGFQILDVSMADTSGRFGDHAKWLKMVHNMGLTWTNVYGLEAFQAYGIESTPQNYLIDPAGKVIAHDVHGEALDKKLEDLLGK